MPADPKPEYRKGNKARRIIDPEAIRAAKLRWPHCAACGAFGGNGHHVLPKDRGGDDVTGNIVVLCGSGTSLCHGAHHGSPYVAQPIGRLHLSEGERRDAAWVNERVAQTILRDRPDVVGYLVGKLGARGAAVFMHATYGVDVVASG